MLFCYWYTFTIPGGYGGRDIVYHDLVILRPEVWTDAEKQQKRLADNVTRGMIIFSVLNAVLAGAVVYSYLVMVGLAP